VKQTQTIWSNWNTTIPDYKFSSKEGEIIEWEIVNNSLQIGTKDALLEFISVDQFCGGDININNCSSLEKLLCYNNNLASITIENCSNLQFFDGQNNPLGNLTVTSSPALKFLICQNCSLSSLELSNLAELTNLHCYNNNLSSLDLSSLSNLQYLDCQLNSLETLDLASTAKLHTIYCNNNKLTNIIGVATCFDTNSSKIHFAASNNNLSEEMLNQIFQDLPSKNAAEKNWNIYVSDNPGTETCNKELATNKGWVVD